MAIIYSYPDNTNILLTDLLIGTSTVRIAGKKKNLTKNFTVEALSIFLNNQNPIAWGNISGNIENQTDLWNALESKQGNITLTTIGSDGASTLIGDTLNIPNYSAGVIVPTLDQVLKEGNSSEESIILTNPYTLDYTLTNTLTSLNSYFTFVSPTQTNYSADYAGYGILLDSDFEGESRSAGIDVNGLNIDWNLGFQYGSVNLSPGGPGLGGGKITFYDNNSFGSIRINNITENVVLEFPNKSGTYTIATTDDIPTIGTWGELNYPNWTTGTPFVKMTAVGTFTLDTNTYLTSITSSDVTTALGYTPVTNARTLTINGTTYDLSANRSWTIASSPSPLTTKGDLYTFNSGDTRLPVGLNTQVLLADSSTPTGLKWGTNTAATPTGYYGAFQDATNQTAAAINTGYPMRLGIVDLSNGITVVSNSRVTIANTGIYNIQWSAQFTNPTAAEHDVTIWLRKNGVDVPGSAGVVLVPPKHGSADGHVLPSWNFLLDPIAGDYYEFVWSTVNTSVYISFEPAGNPPPSTASVVLTVTQQSGIMAGTGITAINSLTGAAQTLATNGSGTDFNIVSSGTTHTFNLPTASATNRGALSTTDWSTFNGKQNVLNGTGLVKSAAGVISYDTNNYTKIVVKSNAVQSITGTTVNTIVAYHLISGGTFSADDFFRIASMQTTHTQGGTPGAWTTRCYLNTSASLSGALSIASTGPTALSSQYNQLSRNLFLSGGTIKGFPFSGSALSDITNSTGALGSGTYNPANDIYFIIAIQLGSATDTAALQSILITN